jgi:hypothetical protein
MDKQILVPVINSPYHEVAFTGGKFEAIYPVTALDNKLMPTSWPDPFLITDPPEIAGLICICFRGRGGERYIW